MLHTACDTSFQADGSAANEAAIKRYNAEHGTTMAIRKIKYLNNIVEQDHRAVKRVTRPMLGFKAFDAAQGTLVEIELMHMLKKKQMMVEAGDEGSTYAKLIEVGELEARLTALEAQVHAAVPQ